MDFHFYIVSINRIAHIVTISKQDLDLPQIAESISRLIQSQNNLRDLVMLEFWTPAAATTMFDALPSQAHSLTYLRLHDLHQDQYHLLLQLLRSWSGPEDVAHQQQKGMR